MAFPLGHIIMTLSQSVLINLKACLGSDKDTNIKAIGLTQPGFEAMRSESTDLLKWEMGVLLIWPSRLVSVQEW